MFKILSAPANVASQIIRTVAGDLLETRDNLLESTTRKVKKLYMEDWIHCRDTGVLRLGCGLHGFLSIVAMNLKLDSGALESLNSMIRQQTNISNNTNISLELLSSRVHMRKTITTETGGSNKLRDVKPVATKLATSCVLYHDRVTSVLDDLHRWAPPQPATGQYTNGNPNEYDPGVALTKNQNWAFKFHRALMKSLITHSKTNVLVGFTLSQEGNTPDFSATYVVAEMTKRMCQVVELTHIEDDKFVIKSPLEFVSSLDVLANTYNFVKEHKSGILWETTQYDYADRIPDWSSSDQVLQPFQANQLQVVVTGTGEVHPIKFRKEYTRKTVAPTTTEDGNMGALLDGDDSASDMSIDSIQANEEMVHLAHELRGEYSDDDADDNAGDVEQSTDKLETPMESMESMNENRGDGLLTTDETVDFHDMQDTNDRLLAAAANLQEQSAFCEFESIDVPDGVRPYEDEIGEALFSEYINTKDKYQNPDTATVYGKRAPRTRIHTLPPATLQTLFEKWNSAVQQSARVCQEISSRCDEFDVTYVQSCLGHQLSLVLHGGNDDTALASLVTWATPYNKLSGRSVKLDNDNCVIYPSHFVEKTSFSPCIMIWPMTGARVRKQSREQVPSDVLRAREMVETAADGLVGTCLELGSGLTCIGCRQSEGDSGSGGLASHSLRKCAFCLLHWHDDCADQLAKRLPGLLQTHGVRHLHHLDLTPSTMPFMFWWLGDEYQCCILTYNASIVYMILILCSSSYYRNETQLQYMHKFNDLMHRMCNVTYAKFVCLSMRPGVDPAGCVPTIIPYMCQNTRWHGEDDIELAKGGSSSGGSSSSGACRIRTVLANSFYTETLGG